MKIEIRNAVEQDAYLIAKHVRPADRDELWAAAMMRPVEVMRRGMEWSDDVKIVFINNIPTCMWGVVGDSLIGNIGTPWMVATNMADRAPLLFLRKSKRLLVEMLKKYDRLENYVDARNTKAISWLSWLGFKIETPEPYGMLKLPFCKFWMEVSRV